VRVEFHPEALAEFEDAARYYAGIQSGLAQRFISAVERIIVQISEAPDCWLILEHDIRRCLTRVCTLYN
jgi:hypothetical protein